MALDLASAAEVSCFFFWFSMMVFHTENGRSICFTQRNFGNWNIYVILIRSSDRNCHQCSKNNRLLVFRSTAIPYDFEVSLVFHRMTIGYQIVDTIVNSPLLLWLIYRCWKLLWNYGWTVLLLLLFAMLNMGLPKPWGTPKKAGWSMIRQWQEHGWFRGTTMDWKPPDSG